MDDPGELIPAPDDPAEWPAWRARLARWRGEVREDGAGPFDWVCRCITTHKVFLWDERFLDRAGGGYRVDAYVDAFERRFGPLDGVILWHAYPNLGFDERNQFDFYRRMPGGLAGLRNAVDRLHERDVRVILDYNPWDGSTRREGRPDHEVLAELVGELDADGLFLDTAAEAVPGLRAALDAVRPGVILQAQSSPPLERLADHRMSWAETVRDTRAPGILRNAWFDRSHMIHVVRRWMTDRSGELQLAWMNGTGMMVWENVFGSWNGWSDRDALRLRLWSAVRRQWSDHFSLGTWTPLAARPADGVFASSRDFRGVRLWTLVNRNDAPVHGVPLPVSTEDADDLMAGRRLAVSNGCAAVDLPARGLGAVLEAASDTAFLQHQASLHAGLSGASERARPVTVCAAPAKRTSPCSKPPRGMVRVAGYSGLRRVAFRRRECGFHDGVPIPGLEDLVLPGLHDEVETTVRESISDFAIGAGSVTNAEFSGFLAATGYRPRHGDAFLEDWNDDWPPGFADEPVRWIDPDDARAYARWCGHRLPTEAEWQAAAEQGLLEDDRVRVWNWTEPARSDGRTRFRILKGGSDFVAKGSRWYADGGRRSAAFGAKYLLLWPGLDRCGTIGFRTVVDLRRTGTPAGRADGGVT